MQRRLFLQALAASPAVMTAADGELWVAVTEKTSSQYFLVEMLAAAGLSEADVKLVSMEGPDMPAALVKRDIDAMAMWEPHAQNAISALGADAVVWQDPSIYRERFNLNTNLR